MPVFGSGMMMTCTVKVYEYSSNKSFTITFGGHRDSDNWYNIFCYFDGDGNRGDLTVRFGLDDGVNCVWIGETSNQWSYPQVFVTDVQMGYVGYNTSWLSGWSVGFVTSFGTVNRTATAFQKITTTNIGSQSVSFATSSGTFSTNWTNYKGVTENSVAGQLMWKNYGNNHTIFDASNSTSPTGSGVNNANSDIAWTGTYPTLMGWNGVNTYGVRVDSARLADTAGSLTSMNISQFTNNSGYITGSYVVANGTSAGNIDADWGQSFKTFDPIPTGTPPLQSPNIRTINVGDSYSRRTQLAFDYASDVAYFRRRTEAGWFTWREFIHSGNIGSFALTSYSETDTLSSVTGRGATTASQVSFTKTDDHAISVGTIRGRAVGSQTGEFIQLYERVNIGGPNGWGAANTAAPSYGLSVYGGANIGYGNNASLFAYAYRGNGNVGGTGEASWHPAGIYSGGTQWLYGTTYRNNASTSGQGQMYFDGNYGYGMVGLYASTRYQAIFAMGDAYKLPADGTTTGSLYGLAWSHPNAGGVAGNLNTHGLLVMENGTFLAAISGSIRSRDDMRAPIFYDSANTAYYGDFAGISSMYGVAIRGDQSSTDTSNQIFFWSAGNTTTSAIGFKANGGYFTNPTGAGDGYNTYFTMDSPGRGWVFREGRGGADFGAAYTSGWILNNGVWQANASMRAPIFYDSQDTNYYLDPNGSSVLNGTVVIKGNDNQLAIDGTTGALASGLFFRESGNNKYELYHYSGEFRFYNYTTGQQEMSINNAGGFVTARTSFRAPIFYDSENTGYYGDFASTSVMNAIRLGTSTNSGTISGGGDWGIRFANDNGWIQFGPANNSWTHIYTDKNFYFNQNLYVNGTQVVLNSGTWGINITGSAGTASAAGRASALDIVGYGSGNMTYYQTSGTFAGYSGWAGYFVSNHGDGATYYNQTIIMPFWGPPQYSRLQGGTFVGPYTFWSTENLNDYAPNMNQYVRTTDNVTFNTTTSPTILVNGHSDNTKGYRIHNTSGSSVSAMFTNSSNQLVIAAGAVDQINLNKKVLVNAVALGVNIAPSATAGRIDASNDIVAYSSSDERLKQNITPIANALDKVKSLTGVEFDWKPEHKEAHGHEGHDTGIIAQQVLGVMPTAVRTNDTGYLAVRYEKLIGLLIEANKELAARVEELEKKIG